jgi:predicted permease
LVANSVSRLLIVPLLAYLLTQVLELPPKEGAVLVLFFALPSAPTAYVLTRQLGGDAHLMAGVITLQTLLSALSLPMIMRTMI